MATFQDLKTRVKNYLIDVPTKTDALVGDWVNKAIRDAEQQHDFHHMKQLLSATTTEGTPTLAALPSTWKAPREVPFRVLDDGSYLEMGMITNYADFRRQFLTTDAEDRDEPKHIYINTEDETIDLLPIPDNDGDFSNNYKIEVPYWGYSALLVNASDTNWFTDHADWYVTFFAAAEGMLFNRDHQEAQLNFERARLQFDQLKSEDKKRNRRAPRQLVPRGSVYKASRGLPRR